MKYSFRRLSYKSIIAVAAAAGVAALPLMAHALERTAVGDKNAQSVNAFSMQMEATKAAVQAAMNDALARIAMLEGRMDDLELTTENLDSRMTVAESEITSLKARVSSLESRMGTAEADIATLKIQMAALMTRVANLEAYVNWLNGRIGTLETQMVSANNRLGALESDMANTKSRVSSLEGEMTSAKNRISSLEAEVNSLKNRVSSLESRVAALEGNAVPNELPTANRCTGSYAISNGSVWGCEVLVSLSTSACGGYRCSYEQHVDATIHRACQERGYSYSTGVKSTYGSGCKSCTNAYWTGSSWHSYSNDNTAAIGSIGCFQGP